MSGDYSDAILLVVFLELSCRLACELSSEGACPPSRCNTAGRYR